MATALDVANYFLNLADNGEESGELLSNLKTQKLVYYAQGFSLAILDEPLFEDSIEAWTHGPVVPNLYQEFKGYGSGPIPAPEDFDASEHFSGEQIELLNEVMDVYGQFSAWKLRNLTHEESPWKNNAATASRITEEELKEFFSNLIDE